MQTTHMVLRVFYTRQCGKPEDFVNGTLDDKSTMLTVHCFVNCVVLCDVSIACALRYGNK